MIRLKIALIVAGLIILTFFGLKLIDYNKNLLKIVYLDVGQGDASLITTASRQNILIDCGPDQIILSALNRHIRWWNKQIDLVIISHDHADHWGGLIYLSKKYQINKVLLATPPKLSNELSALLKQLASQETKIINIYAPAEIKLPDNSRLSILWPNNQQINDFIDDPNNQSLVILWQYGLNSFLWTGDLESTAENKIINNKKLSKSINLLKIGHHGSWTASSPDWLNYWQPNLALISVGLNNKFNLPSQITIDRLKRLNIKIWHTDLDGDLVIYSNGQLVWQIKK
jgi:competence protein ComEC